MAATGIDEVESAVRDVASEYPPALLDKAAEDTRRQVFQVGVAHRLAPAGNIADVGGGIGTFSAACAKLGMNATVIDDFCDPANDRYGDDALNIHRALGVKIESRDVIRDGLGLEPGSMDIITTFDSMEHWHHSPKWLFAEVMAALRTGGWFFLGVPNCVNLRKRISVPLGHGKWTSMQDWYEQPVFRGHVREPDVSDLHYIARDMGLRRATVLGRNWAGYASRYPAVRTLVPFVDGLLRYRPSLCSDIYLLGQKPQS